MKSMIECERRVVREVLVTFADKMWKTMELWSLDVSRRAI